MVLPNGMRVVIYNNKSYSSHKVGIDLFCMTFNDHMPHAEIAIRKNLFEPIFHKWWKEAFSTELKIYEEDNSIT